MSLFSHQTSNDSQIALTYPFALWPPEQALENQDKWDEPDGKNLHGCYERTCCRRSFMNEPMVRMVQLQLLQFFTQDPKTSPKSLLQRARLHSQLESRRFVPAALCKSLRVDFFLGLFQWIG